jgi:amidase
MSSRHVAIDKEDIPWLGVVDLIRALDGRTISPTEVMAQTLSRIDALNPSINAFVFIAHERALQEAADSERRINQGRGRPLEGVPIGIKDDTEVAGMPTSEGTAVVPSHTPAQDAHLVAVLREAGAIVVGKTNLPEFGTIAVTESTRWGACRNPWDLTLTSGGSSGGSAAAVAAGLVAAAHGCDGGGSLRIPGSCCGVFTVKPTRGRISVAPFGSESPLTSHGFMTRSVRDNALLMDIANGNVPGDLFWTSRPHSSYLSTLAQSGTARRLRIAWTAVPPMPAVVHPACLDAVRHTASMCAGLGHAVEETTPDWRSDNVQADFMAIWSVLIGAFAESLLDAGGDINAMEPHNRALYELGRSTPATTHLTTSGRLRQLARRIVASWDGYDVVLTPTLAQPPPPVGALFRDPGDPLSVLHRTFAFTPFTPIVNVTGQPAAQLPIAMHGGAPVGVQAIAAQGDERVLFQLSGELEQAQVWLTRRPALAIGAGG